MARNGIGSALWLAFIFATTWGVVLSAIIFVWLRA